jgi:hypothetical protein
MAITSEPGGTYSVIFNAQYAIDPSDRTAQTAADMRAAYTILKAVESTETIAGAIPTRTFTPGVYIGGCRYRCGKCYYYIRWQRSLHFLDLPLLAWLT